MSSNTINTGTLTGFSGGVPQDLRVGCGKISATRALAQCSRARNRQNFESYKPSTQIDPIMLPRSFVSVSQSDESTGYTDEMMHADLQFWGLEDVPGNSVLN